MSFSRISHTLFALCSISFAMQSYGELIMIRHPPKVENGSIVQNLTCMCENDGSALIWNEKLTSSKKYADLNTPTSEYTAIINTRCHENMTLDGWEFAHTLDNSTGPIFDYRLEGGELPSTGLKRRPSAPVYTLSNPQLDAVIFSARGSGNICTKLYGDNSCHSITFSEDEMPLIDSCYDVDCEPKQSSNISRYGEKGKVEWRTFIIKWDSKEKKIQAYVNGTEQKAKKVFQKWETLGKLKLSFTDTAFFQLQFYNYFSTTKDHANLTTREFINTDGELCFQLPVSLCSECAMVVEVVDRKNDSWTIGNISGDGKLTYGGLPTWQIVELNSTFVNGYQNPIRVKFFTVNNNPNKTGYWAIGTSRSCGDPVRRSTQTFSSPSKGSDIACQKLFYTENSIVHSNQSIANISSTSLDQCLKGGMGSFCDFGCDGSCTGTSICNPTGCTCAPGFKGNDCNEECTAGYYGYNCQRSCECEGQCNKITGLCDTKEYKVLQVLHRAPNYWILLVVFSLLVICSVIIACCLCRKRKGTYNNLQSSVLTYENNSLREPVIEPEKSPFKCCAQLDKLIIFENYVRKVVENGVLHQQFLRLPRGLVWSCEYGKLPENRLKNRYRNLIAYDETRVVLEKNSSGPHSDYINANYIQGYCKEKAYIATQAPLPETVVDFWRMIWQEDVRVICMLVDLVEDGQIMCEQYWPEVGTEKKYGDIIVSNLERRVFAHYTSRMLLVTKRGGTEFRRVEHLQYTDWPAKGIPMHSHSIAEYSNELLSLFPGHGPIVVHCNDGVGRTGAIILCDITIRNLAAEGTVDVFVEAEKMNNSRANMLDNFPQYVLAHLIPIQCLLFLPTKLTCNDVSPEKIEKMKNDLPLHMERLNDSAWMDKALCPVEPLRPPIPENLLKNRFPKLTPVGPSLVTLSPYPTNDGNSSYISAVSVDGVKIRKQYLASQLPMPSTITDFWRLIIEKKVEVVVILQRPDPADHSCCDIIPHAKPLIPVPNIEIKAKTSSDTSEYFTTDKLVLTDTSRARPKSRFITILTCNDWHLDDNGRPPKPKALVELWKASEKIQRVGGPTLVLCHDGLTSCGLYLALSFMLERMTVEQECDVILAVRAIRRSRLEFVYSKWEFEYLYDAALKYTEDFRDYDNFM